MKNFNTQRYQIGSSMWGLIGGAGLFVLFALVTMKLVPAYLDNNKVVNALESVAEKPGVANWNRRQILTQIGNTMYVDMASGLIDLETAVVITKKGRKKTISIDYERVIPMAFNVSALLDFENSVEISLQ